MAHAKGVFTAKKKDGTEYYRSSLTFRGKHISLGSFSNESQASQAYTEGSSLLSDKEITIHNYLEKIHTLKYNKSVSLLNMRDNGIYFKTPIYMYPKYFEYHLGPEEILKFDVDDLFFYSTHSIMKRGGHLFVADYGMQLNILNRYGIKNYAVLNKDYIFKNGDTTDFRYKNIEIINRYNGVTRHTHNGRIIYIAKLHINGDFIIGKYKDEKDAAIAYNKAIAILQEHGIHKNYLPNYIDGMTSVEYATRYNTVKISDKIISGEFSI